MQLSFVALKIFRAFLVSTGTMRHGYDLVPETKTPKFTLYPLLHRMQEQGWLDEHKDTSTSKRQKKYYSITETGVEAGREALEAVQMPSLMMASGST